MVSGDTTHFKSDGVLEGKAIQDVTHAERKKKKKGTFGGSSKETRTSYTSTPVHMTVTSGKDILLESQSDMTVQAPKLKSEGATTFISHDGKVTIKAPKAVHVSTKTKESQNAVLQSQQRKGRVGEKVSVADIRAKGGVFIQAAKGVEVEVRASKDLSTYLDRLESRPETSWIKVVRQIPGVKWHEIAEEHKKWNKKSQGLTPAASVVVALAIGVAIGCSGAGLAVAGLFESATASATIGAMAKGGFIALASQAGVFLLNNGGDIGKTFADLGKTESLESLAIGMMTAGLLEGLTEPLSLPAQPTTFVEHLHVNAVQTGVSTSLSVPLQGDDMTGSLVDGVLVTALNTATGYASTKIGQARVGEIAEKGGKRVLVSGGLDGFTHKL
ncbi:MAG: DUF637 domain-containing protein [Proteobacteria bacterium]|nr:DUF637 domain-containing protein [Pseudomonadota bacterium]